MAVPIAARDVAAVVGALLVLTAAVSVVGTLIVPRPVASWLTRWVDVIVNGAFSLITSPVASYKRRDRILAAQAAAILLGPPEGDSSPIWPTCGPGCGSGACPVERAGSAAGAVKGALPAAQWLGRADQATRTTYSPRTNLDAYLAGGRERRWLGPPLTGTTAAVRAPVSSPRRRGCRLISRRRPGTSHRPAWPGPGRP